MNYLRAKLRKFGWRRFAVVAWRLLRERLCRKDHYFLFKRATAPFHAPKPSTLRAFPITPETIARFSRTFPYRPESFLRRLARGMHGFFYLREDGAPVGYHWYVLHADYYEPAYHWTFRLGEHEAYVLDGYVLPERRGLSTTAQGVAYTQDQARERGARTFFSVADKNNTASWKLHLHLGFEVIGCLEVTRVLNRAIRTRQVDPAPHTGPEMLAAIERHARRKPASQTGLVSPDSRTDVGQAARLRPVTNAS